MAINLEALYMFRAATNWTEDGIANLDGEHAIKKNGEYGGAFSAIGRGKNIQAANNAVRTELLRALGKAFSLDGMSESNGKVRFTAAFMRKLERVLGADLKRDDFKIDANGCVSSGRPLTARRINAILAKAESAAFEGATGDTEGATESTGKTEGTSSVGKPIKTRFGGIRKEIYTPYLEKLYAIKKELPAFERAKQEHVAKFFKRVEMTLDYLCNELDVDRDPDKPDVDKSVLRNSKAYEYYAFELKEKPPKDVHRFEYLDTKSGEYRPLTAGTDYRDKILWFRIGGGLIHTEDVRFDYENAKDIAPLRKYIVNNAKMFVMKAIDTFFAAKKAGKMDKFVEHLKSPGACIEEQGKQLIAFEDKHLSDGLDGTPVDEAKEIERIALLAPEKLNTPDIDEIITTTLDSKDFAAMVEKKEKWDDELAGALKEKLLGKTVAITKYNTSSHKFEPLLVDGKQVVRPLTEEDIDTFGSLIFKEVYMV